MSLRKTSLNFKLSIRITGKKRHIEHFEKKLQIRLSHRYQISCFFILGNIAIRCQRYFRCSYCSFYGTFFRISVEQFKIQYRTERISPIGRKRSGIKINLSNKIGIYNADRSSRSSLCTKMIYIRNFHPI